MTLATTSEKCTRCGYNEFPDSLVMHRINKNYQNNKPENFITLCINCQIGILYGEIHTVKFVPKIKEHNEYIMIGKEQYACIPYGSEMDGETYHEDKCPACGCRVGEFHECGCELEECPKCGGQLISCKCKAR